MRSAEGVRAEVRTELPGNSLAASAARGFVRTALEGWGLVGPPVDDALLLVSELVTNAVVHAGTAVGLACRYEGCALVAEISDLHPSRAVLTQGRGPAEEAYGHGLRLVAGLADEWGVSYRRTRKTVWFRLELGEDRAPLGPAVLDLATTDGTGALLAPVSGHFVIPEGVEAGAHAGPHEAGPRGSGAHGSGSHWVSHGALSFLAEASDMLAGQTDEEMVASLAGQLMVPRFADWCAVWLQDPAEQAPPRLARVWHLRESRLDELRAALDRTPPPLRPSRVPGQAVPLPWPGEPSAYGPGGAAAVCALVVGGRPVGSLAIGRSGQVRIADEVLAIVEDFARRVALAVLSARRYTRQATISRVLQRGLLPSDEVAIPGVQTAVVYEPAGEGSWAGGDFYDFFRTPEGRWRFALGDVCGNGPEAALVTGLARPVLRLLAREGYAVPEVLNRLNREVGEQARFLSLLYGELAPRPASEGGGADCTLVCAGHPLPLVRSVSGEVRAAAVPQLLLGVVDDVAYESGSFRLAPGETLLCVTDGVTERRSGARQFDDGEGLARAFSACAGRDAGATAEYIRRAVHAFAPTPPADDLAMLVLQTDEL
ncbi:SpoIIE family protein phosphatase [Streptomyces sp. ODS28]|uniref:SpoIIE family protein phosphatase n=1 Tax=Streptomyces sp. ODS28 TaxID=3136688 RepID=UPI0031E6430A